MTRYCQKCGKELIRDRVIGFDQETGNPVAEYSCPVFLKEIKELKKKKKGLEDRVKEIYNSKENKNPWYKVLFTGRTIKKTFFQIFLEEDEKLYKGTSFSRRFGLILQHEHDNGVEVTETKEVK